MKLIYVASPYKGDIKKNIEYAKEACRYVLNQGNAFFCPHLLYPQVLDDNHPEERRLGINIGKEFLAKCDELWAFGGHISHGMFEEIEFARKIGIPVKRIIQLDFEIEEKTFLAGSEYSEDILKVSAERISSEFFKILLSDRPSKGIKAMETMGLLEAIIPELIPTIGFNQKNPNHSKDVFNHILCVLDGTPKKLHIRLAALLHDIGKPHTFTVDEEGVGHFYGHDKVGAEITSNVLERLKCSKELTCKVKILVREHMTHHAKFKDKGIKRFIRRVGEENIYDLFELWRADRRCSNENASLENIYETEKRIISILEKKEPFKINQLDINGNDLIQLGLEEGKIIKDALELHEK